MRTYKNARRALQRRVQAKRRRRSELAKLPFKRKIAIVVKMQEIENGIRRSQGRPERPVWPL
ncbi:MAG: hypothetical protein WC728_11625 [Elusimicrobiota bacterium]